MNGHFIKLLFQNCCAVQYKKESTECILVDSDKSDGCVQTAVGAVVSILGENNNPLKGNRVQGVRVEQRVRIHKKVKLCLTGARLAAAGSTVNDRGHAYGFETVYKDATDPQSPELQVSYNHMKHRRQGVHGATVAYQKHLTPETVMNSRVQYSSSGQSSLNLRVTSHDKPQLAYAFLVPTLGWIFDKVTRRGQESQDF